MIYMNFLKQNLLILGERPVYHDKNLAILTLGYEYICIYKILACLFMCVYIILTLSQSVAYHNEYLNQVILSEST